MKNVVKYLVAASILLGLWAGSSALVSAESEVTIKILAQEYPNTRAEKAIKGEFEKETGIAVEYTFLPWTGAHEKVKLELATGGKSYDIYMYDTYLAVPFKKMGGFEPMDKYIEDPSLPDIDVESVVGNEIELYGMQEGKVILVPVYPAMRLYAYRKDLFFDPAEQAKFREQYGYELAPPATWDQFKDICMFFTRDTDGDGAIDFWGIDEGFAIGPAWEQLSDVYTSFEPIKDGRYWIDNDYNVIFDNEKAVRALQLWVDLADAGCIAPGYMKRTWGEIVEVFNEGKAAMTGAWHDEFEITETTPGVQGKAGYFPIPKHDIHHTLLAGQVYSINKYSEHKEEAYRYLSWVKSVGNDRRMALSDEKALPMRTPNLFDLDVVKKQPYTLGVAQAFQYSSPIPLFPEFEELYTELSVAVQSALVKEKTAEEAIHDAAVQFKKVMERAGY